MFFGIFVCVCACVLVCLYACVPVFCIHISICVYCTPIIHDEHFLLKRGTPFFRGMHAIGFVDIGDYATAYPLFNQVLCEHILTMLLALSNVGSPFSLFVLDTPFSHRIPVTPQFHPHYGTPCSHPLWYSVLTAIMVLLTPKSVKSFANAQAPFYVWTETPTGSLEPTPPT